MHYNIARRQGSESDHIRARIIICGWKLNFSRSYDGNSDGNASKVLGYENRSSKMRNGSFGSSKKGLTSGIEAVNPLSWMDNIRVTMPIYIWRGLRWVRGRLFAADGWVGVIPCEKQLIWSQIWLIYKLKAIRRIILLRSLGLSRATATGVHLLITSHFLETGLTARVLN